MKSHIRPLLAFAVVGLLASSGQADQNLTGNTVVGGKLGIGLPVTSPVTVPASELYVAGSGLFRGNWNGLFLQEPSTTGSAAYGVRFLNHTQNGLLQFYYDPAFPSGTNEQIMGVQNDGGLVVGREGISGGYRLHIRRAMNDSGGLAISAPSGNNPNLAFLDANYNLRFQIRGFETTSPYPVEFRVAPATGSSVVTTLALYPSGVAGQAGNVAIGGQVPQERLDVSGNIKASGTISASDPSAAEHVVTKQWLEAGAWHIQPQGDILMGEFDTNPAP